VSAAFSRVLPPSRFHNLRGHFYNVFDEIVFVRHIAVCDEGIFICIVANSQKFAKFGEFAARKYFTENIYYG
jgi:hypothetical protein